MEGILQIVTYGSVVVFVTAIVVRFMRIQKYPLNVRWEIYPVPHEGKRAEHGGSRLEEIDWWEKEHPKDKARELKHMLAEMVFIQALRENNFKLWRFSFPFHFGLYLTASFAALVVLLGVLGVFEINLGEQVAMGVAAYGVLAMGLSGIGALGLLGMRLTDEDMRPYTNFGHIFNLLLFVAVLGVTIAAIAVSGWTVTPFAEFCASLATFNLTHATTEPLVFYSVLTASLLLAYIPLTHMSHFFVKWFTWHKIRWDDEPNVKGGRIEKMIQQALGYKVSWAAEHIKGEGKKSWADVATEDMESK